MNEHKQNFRSMNHGIRNKIDRISERLQCIHETHAHHFQLNIFSSDNSLFRSFQALLISTCTEITWIFFVLELHGFFSSLENCPQKSELVVNYRLYEIYIYVIACTQIVHSCSKLPTFFARKRRRVRLKLSGLLKMHTMLLKERKN